ncbi:MAG: hypothetical protein ACOYNO_07225 [Saprospiraceae bacterium]
MPSTHNATVQHIRALIQQSKLEEAMEQLNTLNIQLNAGIGNDVSMLSSRLASAKQQYTIQGAIKWEDYQQTINQVTAALLHVIDNLPDQSPNPTSPIPGHKSPIEHPKSDIPKFLVVYDIRDDAAAKMLKKHMNVSLMTKKVQAHFVHAVAASEITLDRARAEMQDSDYVVALVSANLFDSPDWAGLVFEALDNGRKVVPVRIEPFDYSDTPLAKRRSLPSRERTIADFPSIDAAYVDVVEGLKQL